MSDRTRFLYQIPSALRRPKGIQKLFTFLLIATLVGLILISFGNSQTAPLSDVGSTKYQEAPGKSLGDTGGDFPFSPNLDNIDPSNLPPIDPGNIPGGGIPTGSPPDISPPDIPTGNPPNVNPPDIPTANPPSIDPPDINPPDINPPGGSPGGGNSPNINVSPPSFNVDQKDPKYRFFPSFNLTDLGNIKISIGDIEIDFSISISVVILLILLALPLLITKIFTPWALSLMKETEEIPQTDVVDRKRQKELEEQERKRRAERKRRLLTFRDYVMDILSHISVLEKSLTPEEIVIEVYHELDEAFSKFSALKREPGVTPLEHSHSAFTSDEVNTSALESIVNMFYLSRFGRKEINQSHIEELRFLLGNLVKEEILNE